MTYKSKIMADLEGKKVDVLSKEDKGLYVCECEVDGKKVKLKVHVALPDSAPQKIRIAWLTRCDQLSSSTYELFGGFDADFED